MRDPNNLHSFYEYADDVKGVVQIKELPPFEIPDYDLNDDKDVKKYLTDIERVIRGSYEYRYKWLKYLRDYVDMNKCSFYENVTNVDTTKIKIEIHHDPLSLYDIVSIVYNKRVFFRESLEVEMVAKEVMYHHFALSIGVIPLAETVHELVHNQYLFVPTSKVYGNYRKFIDEYRDFIPVETMDALNNIEELSQVYNADEYQNLLQRKYIYVDVTGAYNLPKLETIAQLMKHRIKVILNENEDTNQAQNNKKEIYCPIIFEN